MKTLRISLLGSGRGLFPGFPAVCGEFSGGCRKEQSRTNDHLFVKHMTEDRGLSVSPRLTVAEKLIIIFTRSDARFYAAVYKTTPNNLLRE
jgi:hypothetical protein